MQYREDPSYQIKSLKVNGKLVTDSIFDSQYREDEIALQSKDQSANIKEKLEGENDNSNKCIRSD